VKPLSHAISADLTGAVDLLASPFFGEDNQLPKYSSIAPPVRLKPAGRRLLQFLTTLPIDQNLITTLTTLSTFSHQISLILANPATANIPSQITLLKETYGLRYSLVQSPDPLQVDSASTPPSDQMLNEVLRIGALLYIQATLQEFPFSAVGSRNLVVKLKESVMMVKIRNRQEGELMVWLLFMGGMEARDELERAWFVVQIRKLAGRLAMEWEDVKKALEGLWWVRRIHEETARKLWAEVEIGMGVDKMMAFY
jgi:hypothetical protein